MTSRAATMRDWGKFPPPAASATSPNVGGTPAGWKSGRRAMATLVMALMLTGPLLVRCRRGPTGTGFASPHPGKNEAEAADFAARPKVLDRRDVARHRATSRAERVRRACRKSRQGAGFFG